MDVSIFEKAKIGCAYIFFFSIAAAWASLLIYGALEGLSYATDGYTQRLLMNSRRSLWVQSAIIFFVLKMLCPWCWNKGMEWREKIGTS